ncbi:SusD/RagB family nutrient-binding outer membrane lipoprotein, partial [Aureitalea sp. L0-47]|uniref:SusD/RagB family nutrient-binding outer membrane lipoprotein n=1 Tax=Aureitalea sp. L0-47 TaxID=2816962 RepID=UPI002238A261
TLFTACETVELELLVNPNQVGEENSDPNFILNDVQITFARNIWNGFNGPSSSLTRMTNLFGFYNGAIDENTLLTEWTQSYQMFGNIDLIQGLNEVDIENGGEGLPNHIGVAQVLEAFTYMLLVDYVNNVPYSEANQPEEFPNPNADAGKVVYDAQIELLDEAIANLQAGGLVEPETDLYFGSFDAENWIALANTLKLRAYNNLRLTDAARATAGINATATSNIIDSSSEDFSFGYSDIQDPAESRHPYFTNGYLAAGAASYMSNQFLDFLNAGDNQPPFIETGDIDPRTRYYLYRQTGTEPSGSDLPCAGDARYDYCYVGNLYWGRDHTDDAGIPNDGFKRTTFGIYPGGGAFDRDEFVQARQTENNLGGAGILPIYLASHTHFLLAETALTLGTNGNPANLLAEGIRISLDKVDDFAGNLGEAPFAMTQADKDAYVAGVLQEFNGGNNQQKLAVIAREAMLASWGNGVEVYNMYRRTGFPDVQSPIIPAGAFPRGFRYPVDEVENNPNIQQRQLTDQVFWD